MFYYCPLEPLRERYTMQLSAPRTGWLERHWREHEITYIRVDPKPLETGSIALGSVVDGVGRPNHCFAQVSWLLAEIGQGHLTSDDIIYFDDFWHPGLEAIAYACNLANIQPKMYAFCWAQSVDKYDFTAKMKPWIRGIERGYAMIYDGIFVANTMLQGLLAECMVAPREKVHVVGLPFDSDEVRSRCPFDYIKSVEGGDEYERDDKVVFSSRWDWEKRPLDFLDIAKAVLALRPDTRFVICTSAAQLRSNRPSLLEALDAALEEYPFQITLLEGLTKEQYYAQLCGAKVQLNTSLQDWVSFTLLEASVAGCFPMYPNHRSFPETLAESSEYLHDPDDVEGTARKIVSVLDSKQLWTREAIVSRSWIHERYDSTWARMARVMGLPLLEGSTVGQEACYQSTPPCATY